MATKQQRKTARRKAKQVKKQPKSRPFSQPPYNSAEILAMTMLLANWHDRSNGSDKSP